MIRFRNDLFAAMFFAPIFLGLPGRLCAQAPDAAFEPSAIAAVDAHAESKENEVLRTVLETRDEVRALRREVDRLRKIVESAGGKSESNPRPERIPDNASARVEAFRSLLAEAASDKAAYERAKTLHGPPRAYAVPLLVERYFVGNKSVSGERLAMEIKSTPASASIGGKFDPTKLKDDVASVRKYYENLGFFDADVRPTAAYSKDGKWIYLRYTVQEGPQYRIRNCSVMGNKRFKTDELLAIKTREGQFYNASTIKKDIETIKKKYDHVGHNPVTVEVVPRYLEQPGVMDLVLRINEDKQDDVRADPRVYPVADLVLPLPGREKSDVGDSFEKLIRLVTDTVAPKSWQKAGGGGSITHYDKTLSLVIRQTPAVHRQVLAFLRSLRSLQEWQVCLELALIENAPADVLKSVGTSGYLEGKMGVHPLTDEQRTKLLDAVQRTPDSKLLSENVTMFYGTRGSIGWAPKEKEIIDFETADSTDRYSVNLRFGLHDNKNGRPMVEPVAVNVANLKTVVIVFKRIGEGASARPSLLVVKPRLLFPYEEEEVKQ
jgi:hypothetical protein